LVAFWRTVVELGARTRDFILNGENAGRIGHRPSQLIPSSTGC
jgi:hypothetical protein